MLKIQRPFLIKCFNAFGLNVSLSAEALMKAAQKKTGLQNFGDEHLKEALTNLVFSINKEAKMHPFGLFITKQRILNILKNRLLVEFYFDKFPEIKEIDIKQPLIITGLQRTGTTRLHRLLAAHKQVRTLSSWEALNPAPWFNDPKNLKRIRFAKTAEKALRFMSPDFFAIHPVEAEAPEEDVLLNDMSFVSAVPEATMWVPSYAKWVEEQNHLMPYSYLKKVLQILSWQNPKERWVLKTPQHLEYMEAIFQVFPDAKIIHTTRDPIKVVASFSSMLFHSYRVFSDQVDAEKVAKFWLNKDAFMVKKAMPVLQDETRVLTVAYKDMMLNMEGEMKQMCKFLALDFNETFERNLQALNKQNKQHKYGVHRYDLSDFNLSEEQVNEAFKEYRIQFNIGHE